MPFEMLYCRKCGHEWKTIKEKGLPVQCPRCKRCDWQGRITTWKPIKLTEDDVKQIFQKAEEHLKDKMGDKSES